MDVILRVYVKVYSTRHVLSAKKTPAEDCARDVHIARPSSAAQNLSA